MGAGVPTPALFKGELYINSITRNIFISSIRNLNSHWTFNCVTPIEFNIILQLEFSLIEDNYYIISHHRAKKCLKDFFTT